MVDPATSLPIQSALIDDTQALAKELNICKFPGVSDRLFRVHIL